MHIDYPYRIDARGRTGDTSADDYVRDLVEAVLFTAPGERVNRPTFGSGIMQLVFEPNGDELATATQFTVQSALQQWLGDVVEVHAIEVTRHDSTFEVKVRYRPRLSDEARTAVFSRTV